MAVIGTNPLTEQHRKMLEQADKDLSAAADMVERLMGLGLDLGDLKARIETATQTSRQMRQIFWGE